MKSVKTNTHFMHLSLTAKIIKIRTCNWELYRTCKVRSFFCGHSV